MYDVFYTHIDIYCYSTFDLNYIFFYKTYTYIRMIFFVKIFDSFIPVIMLNALRFKCYILHATHTLLDKSLRVLQLPTRLFNLTTDR